MKNFKTVFLLLFFIFINNCSGFQDVMTGKTRTTDEFLVKKKDPLILPPKYGELPLPKSKDQNKKASTENILGSSSESTGDQKSISSLENMILKELRKKD
tara:strand:- start:5661 stop:5960 length:300 start_codon:yes stop_codon:yes gene_type:complete